MTEATFVKELFIRPQAVRKGDFVLELTQGVESPERTAGDYVVTPSLVDAFDRALGLVGSALQDGRSKGAYLHGSFGSGKSHFMAMLSLLLRGDEHAWAKPKLHRLRDKHAFAGQKKLLELHFHMIGKRGLEEALFGEYVRYVAEHHPDAPTPALFADEALFDNARNMLTDIGEEKFFARLNAGTAADDGEDWGSFDSSGRWDRARFDACAASGDPVKRADLFSALTKTHFTAYTSQGAYLEIDAGLYELSRHAKSVGYDAVVMFLDELILWLAHRAAEREWMHDQVQKMVKLVESQHSDRAIPIISFIARQRDLADMVGDDLAGLDAQRLRDSLRHWEGRFDTVGLEDANLPAIVEERVLKKAPGAEEALDRAFNDFKRQAGRDWQTLLGQWDESAFRKLYPFSPALVDTLVALSTFLQRERTAIKLLMELLVDHIEDLRVGEVVRVGDLFDAMIDGTDAADGGLRIRFNAARELYTHKLLPLLHQENGTGTPERCQRLRPDSRVRLGCAGCQEKQCRSDNRVVKTLLIAALVPNVKALSEVTASRLVALNHGTIKTPIRGTEAQQVAGKLRKWSSQLTQIQVDRQVDPTVRVALESVDAVEILRRARELDNEGARTRIVRETLFTALGLDGGKVELEKRQDWRGTKREGLIAFGNVRRMPDDQLRCPETAAFKLVIDYPFDDPKHSPSEDERRVEELAERDGAGWTLVWLPHFFSSEVSTLLGELTILDVMLSNSTHVHAYTSHLPVDQQTRARSDLETLRTAKRGRLEAALEQAYGLRTATEADIDPSLRVQQHLRLLKPGAVFRPAQPASLATALDTYIPAVLDARWPRHPDFGKMLSARRLQHALELFERLVDRDDKEETLDRAELEEVRSTLGQLGLVQTTERVARLNHHGGPLVELENRRMQRLGDEPTAKELRSLIDETGRMGLERDVQDLFLRCYARAYARTITVDGQLRTNGPIPDHARLERPPLPSEEAWRAALSKAGLMLGVTFAGRALHADNLKQLESLVGAKLKDLSPAARALPQALLGWYESFDLPTSSPRLETARSAADLCAELAGKGGKSLVESLAAFSAKTSEHAVGKSMGAGATTLDVLKNALVKGPLTRLRSGLANVEGAASLLEHLQKALRQDESNETLAPRLRELAESVQHLEPASPAAPERVAAPPPKKAKNIASAKFTDERDQKAAAAKLRALADQLESGERRFLRGTVEVWEDEG